MSSVAGRTDERFQSPDLQREYMERWANVRYPGDHEWLAWFEDLDYSGTYIDRPELNAAGALALESHADIVVYNMSRYSRSVPEGLTALAKLQEHNISVLSASEDIDPSTPEGEFTLTFFLAHSQFLVRGISQAWTQTIERNRDGGWWHGIPPYGYRKLTPREALDAPRSSGVIVLSQPEAQRVQDVYRRYLAGEAISVISRDARNAGWWTRAGKVKDILTNPAYCGMVRQVDTAPARAVGTGQLLRDRNGRVIKRAVPGTAFYFTGQHQALVTPREFIKVRRRLKGTPVVRRQRVLVPRWSAAGHTRCGGCGRNLAYQDKQDMVTSWAGLYLSCANRNCRTKVGAVKLPELEATLEAAIGRLPFAITDQVKELRARHDAANSDVDRQRLERDRTRLKAAVAKASATVLGAMWEDEGMSEDEARAGLAALRSNLAKTEKQLKSKPASVPAPRGLGALADTTTAFAKLWPHMTYQERVDALEAIGADIYIAPSRKHGDTLDGRFTLKLTFAPDTDFEAHVEVRQPLVVP